MRRSFFADLYARRNFNNRMAEPRAVLGLCRLPAGKPCFKPYLRGISPVFISLHRDISRCDPPPTASPQGTGQGKEGDDISNETETVPIKRTRTGADRQSAGVGACRRLVSGGRRHYRKRGQLRSDSVSGKHVCRRRCACHQAARQFRGNGQYTITISTSDDATANVTIEDVNISSSGDSIDVGSSSANITLNGDNKLSSESGSGMHVSDGDVTITGSGSLKAESKGDNNNNAAIGSHENEDMSGDITIGGDAQVTAESGRNGTGIGPGEDKKMKGLIIIQDNAQVTAIAGDCAAAIGSDDGYEMTGTIIIIGNARVTTGVLDDDDVYFDYKTKEIKYTLDEGYIGYIGDSQNSNHESGNGHYIIGPDVTINGLSGSDIEALKDYINMRLSGENNDGEPENLTKLDISSENGEFTVTAEGEGTVEKILYGGSETVPTAPGTYPVTCVVRLDDETIEFQIGTFVVPEPKSPAEAVQSAPLYRVTDKDGVDIAYKAEKNDGVLTITADEDHAVLTGTLAGIEQLKAQGVEKIVFVTNGASSAFSLNDLLEKGEIGETYKLSHDGKTVTFTLGEKMTDISLAYR